MGTDHMAGHREVSPAHKDHTTVVSELARSTAEILLRLTTRLACSLVSRSLVPTPRLCQPNGSSRLVLVRVSSLVINSGSPVSSPTASLRSLVPRSPSTPSQFQVTGTELVFTATSPVRRCANRWHEAHRGRYQEA